MARLLEHGGVDFLAAGTESIGKKNLRGKWAIAVAARTVAFGIEAEDAGDVLA